MLLFSKNAPNARDNSSILLTNADRPFLQNFNTSENYPEKRPYYRDILGKNAVKIIITWSEHEFELIFSVPDWALIDIQSLSALIQRFLFSATLILTSLVVADSVMNISEHLWFSAEHYWQAANRQKDHENRQKSVLFSILMLKTKRREIESFKITSNASFWRKSKVWFFWNLYLLLITWQKTCH